MEQEKTITDFTELIKNEFKKQQKILDESFQKKYGETGSAFDSKHIWNDEKEKNRYLYKPTKTMLKNDVWKTILEKLYSSPDESFGKAIDILRNKKYLRDGIVARENNVLIKTNEVD